MKKFFIICTFIILGSGFAFSQNFATDKGAMILGGTVGFVSTGTEGGSSRSTMLTLAPVYDYFIMQNLFLGGSISLIYTSSSSGGEGTIFSIGPEIGYAFGSAQSSTFPFLKLGFAYTLYSDDFTQTTINIGGGIIIEITKHIGIVGSLSYNLMNTKSAHPNNNLSYSSNSIMLNFGIYGLIYK